MTRRLCLRLAAVLLCLFPLPSAAAEPLPALVEPVRAALVAAQAASFAAGVEHCGLVVRAANGRIIVTPARPGDEASCAPRRAKAGTQILASFHTHGRYDRRYHNEVPSLRDVKSNMKSRTHGFLATPGGRFWHIDGMTGHVRLLCGAGCLPSDPDFPPNAERPIDGQYSPQRLAKHLNR